MRFNWSSFFGVFMIWSFKGFQIKLSDIEEKYSYSGLIPIFLIGIIILILWYLDE